MLKELANAENDRLQSAEELPADLHRGADPTRFGVEWHSAQETLRIDHRDSVSTIPSLHAPLGYPVAGVETIAAPW